MDHASHCTPRDDLTTRIAIVDDDLFVRARLAELLTGTDGIEVTAVLANGAAAVESVRTNPPDVILMDIVMPGMDGIEATRLIRQISPQVRVIALTSFADDEVVARMLRAGAVGYLFKDTLVEGMIHAIFASRHGLSVMSPSLQELAGAVRTPDGGKPTLDPTKAEILHMVCEGLTNEQIARRVHLSSSMIKYHIRSLMMQLGATNRVRLAIRAQEFGLA